MAKWLDGEQQKWQPVRPELTEGVSGKLLLADPVRLVLTRVAPGGSFRPHRDPYRHLFHVLEGEGIFSAGAEERQLVAGMSLQVEAGELHSYCNSGETDLLLLSVNIPVL